jgi:hypothetical protein
MHNLGFEAERLSLLQVVPSTSCLRRGFLASNEKLRAFWTYAHGTTLAQA